MLFFFFYKIINNLNFNFYILNSSNKYKNNFNDTSFKELFSIIDYNNNKLFFNKLILNELFIKFFSNNSKSSNLLKILIINLFFNSLNLDNNFNNITVKKNTKFLNKNILYKGFNKLSYTINSIRQKTKKKFINNLINENEAFNTNIKSKWLINFANTSLDKYINLNSILYNILFLRKNKVFNKGRYSRNRQTYRTGVYWCLYINVILIIGLYFLFYRFSLNYGYLWWGLFLFLFSFIFSKTLKYSFFNPKKILIEWFEILKWLVNLLLK